MAKSILSTVAAAAVGAASALVFSYSSAKPVEESPSASSEGSGPEPRFVETKTLLVQQDSRQLDVLERELRTLREEMASIQAPTEPEELDPEQTGVMHQYEPTDGKASSSVEQTNIRGEHINSEMDIEWEPIVSP